MGAGAGRDRAGARASSRSRRWGSTRARGGGRHFEHFKLIKIFADEYLFLQELGLAGDFPESNNTGCRIRFVTQPSAVGLIESARRRSLAPETFLFSREEAPGHLSAMALRNTTTCSPKARELRVLCFVLFCFSCIMFGLSERGTHPVSYPSNKGKIAGNIPNQS